MKSQKEASNLAQRYSCDNAMSEHGEPNSSESTRLETDLMNQWKSLFLHVENVFVEESNQLVSFDQFIFFLIMLLTKLCLPPFHRLGIILFLRP